MLCLSGVLGSAALLPSAGASYALLARQGSSGGGAEQLTARLLAMMGRGAADPQLACASAGALAALAALTAAAAAAPAAPLSPPRTQQHAAAAAPPRPRDVAAAVPAAALQQLRQLLAWRPPRKGGDGVPALAEAEGFPCLSGLLDGPAALAATVAASQAPRLLQSGVAAAIVALLARSGDDGGGGGAWAELSPAGLVSAMTALQRLLEAEPAALQLALQQPALPQSLLEAAAPPALDAAARFVDATAACNPGNSLGGCPGVRSPLNDGGTAAAALRAAPLAALHAPFALPPASAGHDSALAALQRSLLEQRGLPAALVAAAAAAAPDSEELAAAAGLLARLAMSSDRLLAPFVSAGGLAPAIVEK
jgi:hypothetical protein